MPASIHAIVRPHGGIMPMVRKRSARVLTLAERRRISRGIHADVQSRQIAVSLGRSPSTISREVARHGGLNKYRAALADARAWDRAKRPKPCHLAVNAKLRRLVARKLQTEMGATTDRRLVEATVSDDETMQVSHETIYRVCSSGPWSTQGGTDEASAHAPYDAPFEESVSKGTNRADRSLMRYQSANGLPKPKTGLFRGTGKVTC